MTTLILSGCASLGPQGTHQTTTTTASQSSHAPDSQPRRGMTHSNTASGTSEGQKSGIETIHATNLAEWKQLSNPNNDLWIRVRNGFELPRQYGHPSVDEWVQYYLSHEKHLNASLRRARAYLWHVAEAVSERGMPLELALLPIVESGYNASAVSYSGAGGLWQFMPMTARDMGLRQGWWYDGRFDAMASTRAALDYLSWLHDYFNGNWLLALAAYNAGPGRVEDAIAQAHARGQPTDFWHLNLPRETTAYIPKLFALRRIMVNPNRYAFSWPSLPDKPQTVEVELPAPIEVDIAANMLNMPEERLRELNPGIRHSSTAPEYSDADLLVPIAKADTFRSALAQADPGELVSRDWHVVQSGDTLSGIAHAHGVSVAALRRVNGIAGNRIYAGQRLTLPKPGTPSETPTKPYVVQTGDSLWQIAHRHGISVAALRRVNDLSGNMLRAGQTLDLPLSATPTTYRVQSGDTLWSIAQRYDTSVEQLRKWNRLDGKALQPGQTLAVTGSAPLPDFYHVQDGDTLWSIAHRFEIKVALLRDLNNLGSNNTIQPGQRLLLQPTS